MQDKQNIVTLAFVLVVGLLGGYMIAQHVGHAAESHQQMHQMKEQGKIDDHHAAPSPKDMREDDMSGPDMDRGPQSGAEADIRVQ